ncbi:prepilin-type N-terminal cleavage/methylation domain-containing protein [Dongshaea marina]|uniref:prepilin-type N-terminal cleavage/methylation domain-containing protein n=1 Tax=Dongshaea marina TaxID=2047966 RepID=UPI000D3E1C73|nr:prepilin-type N-terminal cleavage/methylation domain-containing protein [Dongshaea marina]
MYQKQRLGFTLIELITVVAIVAILAAIAIPAYQTYRNKSLFTEVTQATTAYKNPVELCVRLYTTNDPTLDACDAGSNGIPPNLSSATGVVQSVTVSNGVITAVGTAQVNSLSYILQATKSGTGVVIWTPNPPGNEGTCVAAGYC